MSDELKAELKAKLEKQGIEVDHRWGVPKMESVLGELALKDEHVSEPDPEPAQVALPDGMARCRVTKAGDGKIFTGEADPTHYSWDDMITLPIEAAQSLEERFFVEIYE